MISQRSKAKFKYKGIYSKNNGMAAWFSSWTGKSISQQRAAILEKPFEEEEIKQALFSLAGDKAPGPGFTMAFFHDCWDIIKSDLRDLFHEFHVHRKIFRCLNSTFIVLIPKKVGPTIYKTFVPLASSLPPIRFLLRF